MKGEKFFIKYEVKCQYCNKIMNSNARQDKHTCFDCKKKRAKEYQEKRNKL